MSKIKKYCEGLDCAICDEKEPCIYKIANDLQEQLKRKEQEYEELRQYHNKCCEENAKKEAEWLEKYNQVSRDFYNGDYCNTKHCSLLKAKEQECEELKEKYLKLKEQNGSNIVQLNTVNEQLDQLKAENEKIKTALKFRDSNIDAKNKEIIRKCKNNRELIDKNWKLIKTLTEIKNKLTVHKTLYYESKLIEKLHKEILQKISECEVTND